MIWNKTGLILLNPRSWPEAPPSVEPVRATQKILVHEQFFEQFEQFEKIIWTVWTWETLHYLRAMIWNRTGLILLNPRSWPEAPRGQLKRFLFMRVAFAWNSIPMKFIRFFQVHHNIPKCSFLTCQEKCSGGRILTLIKQQSMREWNSVSSLKQLLWKIHLRLINERSRPEAPGSSLLDGGVGEGWRMRLLRRPTKCTCTNCVAQCTEVCNVRRWSNCFEKLIWGL